MRVYVKFGDCPSPELILHAMKNQESEEICDLNFDQQLELFRISDICIKRKLNPFIEDERQIAYEHAEASLSEDLDDWIFHSDAATDYLYDATIKTFWEHTAV